MNAKEYYNSDPPKILFIKPDGSEEINELKYNNILGEPIVRFTSYPIALSTLKLIVKNVSKGISGISIWDLTAKSNSILYNHYINNSKNEEDQIYITINGDNFSVGCRTYTIESAKELNKIL